MRDLAISSDATSVSASEMQIDAFAFDARVAEVFDDMIRRSVPGYGMTLSLLGIIAQHYAKPGTRIYDLGCSLGAGIASMGAKLDTPDITFQGIDNSQPFDPPDFQFWIND